MSTNSDTIDESTAPEDQPLIRITNYSSPENLPKLGAENATACESEGADGSAISRPPVAASNSVNETPKSNKPKRKTKKERCLIPRAKSKKRNENGKHDVPPKVELQKSEKNDTAVPVDKESNNNLAVENSEPVSSMDRIDSKPRGVEKKEEKELNDLEEKKLNDLEEKKLNDLEEKKLNDLEEKELNDLEEKELNDLEEKKWNDLKEKVLQKSSTSFLSCRDYLEVVKLPEKNTQENSKKGTEASGSPKQTKSDNVQENRDPREEKAIRDLYEIIKSAVGPVFENFKSSRSGTNDIKVSESGSQNGMNEAKESFQSIQGQYDFTLNEISNIWINTISLISSVRDHVIQFVEKDAKSVDPEQLTLEAEMLGLAVDVAISYSKLKTDSLIQMVKKRVRGRKLKKTELEDFMDSKAFSFLYSDDDLAAMARTVRDLNVSLLKDENLDFE